jgi:signal peptidase I
MFGAIHVRKHLQATPQDEQLRRDRLVALFVVLVLIVIGLFVVGLAVVGGSSMPALEYWPVVP